MLSAGLVPLGNGCLSRNPKERPTSADLLKHPWMADLVPRSMATPLANISVDGPIMLKVCSLLYILIVRLKAPKADNVDAPHTITRWHGQSWLLVLAC